MKRRNFILSSVFSIFTYKSMVHAFSRSKLIGKNNLLISNANGTCVTLKSGMNYQLPENPVSIQSCIQFKVLKNRLSASPTITSSKHLIANKNRQVTIDKDIDVNHSRYFYLQYISEDIGWILLS